MTPSDRQLIAALFQPQADLNPWQWAEANVDYARARNYDSEWKGPYRIDYLPYLREPLESCADMTIKEIWMWAATRAGKSENLLLTVMRWMLATCPPYAMLYIGGQQTKVEQFFEKRILRGMELSEATTELMKRAKVREHTVDFGGLCDLIISWAANKQVAKGDSYPVIFADEVSSWPGFKADTLRERQATVPFPKLIGVSSADAESRRSSDEDPIIQEWENTDRREYMMLDPGGKKGKRFMFRMGGRETVDGIKWATEAKSKDGAWDLDWVEETAYYVTPCGERVKEKQRRELLAGGVWMPTAKCPAWKRGYRVTRMMTPFPTGAFGNMARTFLEACKKQAAGQTDEDGRPPLRVFIYERLAEKYYASKKIPELTEIDARVSEYEIGERVSVHPAYQPLYDGKRAAVIMTVDVQKYCEWWAVREWIDGGDSALVEAGQSHGLADVREIAVKHKPIGILIDNSYADRAREVIEAASIGILRGAVLSYGRDNLKDKAGQPREYEVFLNRDPYEGTTNQGRFKCNSVTFIPDRLKNQLFALTGALDWHKWRLPRNLPGWYAAQMTAEHSIDGHWSKIRKDNHIWDCEVIQLLASKLYGLWRDSQPMALGTVPAKETATEPAMQPKKPDAPLQVRGGSKACPKCGKAMTEKGGSWFCRNSYCQNFKNVSAQGMIKKLREEKEDDEDDDE